MHYLNQCKHPNVFRAMTGLYVSEFDELVRTVLPAYADAERARLTRPGRKRESAQGIRLD